MPARKRYRLLLSAVVLLALLSVLILSLPVYRFDLTVHTKRSGNTFVGDERYVAARAEVDALAADYAARGIHTEITEEIIERVNSKGETTSLIVFRVNRETDCSGWDFIRSVILRISPNHILIDSPSHQKQENCSESNSHFGQQVGRMQCVRQD